MASRITLLLFVLGILMGCRPGVQSEAQYYQWLNDPDNGLVQTKRINGLEVTVKFLPAEFLAYKESKSYGSAKAQMHDSLLRMYQHNLAFLLTVRPEAGNKATGDIMYQGVGSYPDYKARAMEMNFNLGEYISLRTEKEAFQPVLHTLENTYSAVEGRSIYLVFAENEDQKGLLDAKELDLVFSDEFFGTGISHFTFSKNNLNNTPLIRD